MTATFVIKIFRTKLFPTKRFPTKRFPTKRFPTKLVPTKRFRSQLLGKGFLLFRSRLSRRLLSSFGLSWLIVGGVTLGINYQLIERDLQGQVQRRAQSITQGLQFATEGLIAVNYSSLLNQVVTQYANLPDVEEVAILSPQGETLAHNRVTAIYRPYKDVQPLLDPWVQRAMADNREYSTQVTLEGVRLLVNILPFQNPQLSPHRDRPGVLVVLLNLQPLHQEARTTLLTSSVTLMGGMLLILMFMGTLLRHQVLVPLDALNQAVRRSRQTGDFHLTQTLPANEIRFLAQTFSHVFNQLTLYQRLEQEVKQRTQVEAELRESEARERAKSEALGTALADLQVTQAQLIHNEKMSSLGQMVAGIAHEINNPVNFIHGNLAHIRDYSQDLLELINLYRQALPQPPQDIRDREAELDLGFMVQDMTEILQSMDRGTQRIRDTVLSLRTFSRLDESDLKRVDLHGDLDATLMMVQNRLETACAHPITVVKVYGDLPWVDCYSGQLNQVFLHLFTNAIDALQEVEQWDDRPPLDPLPPDHPLATAIAQGNPQNPHLWVSTEVTPPDPGDPSDRPPQVTIRIRDNGSGIAPAAKDHLFNPFFTTKPVGQGSGMGLSISHQIVVGQHHGHLSAESQPHQGSEFRIDLPLSQSRTA